MTSLPARPKLLEICVETVEAALAANRGGADRIELCANLAVGGVTPSVETMREAREQIHLPIFVIIRPREGNFVYSDHEFAEMKRAIQTAKQSRMDGVAVGILTEDFHIDVQRTQRLLEFTRPLPMTFHRAFDECRDLQQSLVDVIQTGAMRLLTSGGKPKASQGAGIIRGLIVEARNRITVMPGSGIHGGNLAALAAETGARQFHAGLSDVVSDHCNDLLQFEMEVRRLAGQIKNLP